MGPTDAWDETSPCAVELELVEVDAEVEGPSDDAGVGSSPILGFFEGGNTPSPSSSPIESARFLTLSLFLGLVGVEIIAAVDILASCPCIQLPNAS